MIFVTFSAFLAPKGYKHHFQNTYKPQHHSSLPRNIDNIQTSSAKSSLALSYERLSISAFTILRALLAAKTFELYESAPREPNGTIAVQLDLYTISHSPSL